MSIQGSKAMARCSKATIYFLLSPVEGRTSLEGKIQKEDWKEERRKYECSARVEGIITIKLG
jgi:hypothetical protein